jgi:hypothetical protein
VRKRPLSQEEFDEKVREIQERMVRSTLKLQNLKHFLKKQRKERKERG